MSLRIHIQTEIVDHAALRAEVESRYPTAEIVIEAGRGSLTVSVDGGGWDDIAISDELALLLEEWGA